MGYRGPTACGAAGITYRQLDYWARTGLVEPSVRSATGSGTQRLYSFRDILVLKVVKRLLDTGVSLQQIRVAIDHLRSRGVDDLAQITLMSDGASVYECTSADEVIDLVLGGQGVFGIAVGKVWREVEGRWPTCPASGSTTTPSSGGHRRSWPPTSRAVPPEPGPYLVHSSADDLVWEVLARSVRTADGEGAEGQPPGTSQAKDPRVGHSDRDDRVRQRGRGQVPPPGDP